MTVKRPRKAEVEAMVDLLDRDWEDITDTAKAVLALAWELADARDHFGMVLDQPGVAVTLHGPFDSRSQADKFLRTFPLAGPARPRVLVAQMTNVSDTTEGLFE